MTMITLKKHVATITEIASNGYGEREFRVKVVNTNGAHFAGDCVYTKGFETLAAAQRAASRELKKAAN